MREWKCPATLHAIYPPTATPNRPPVTIAGRRVRGGVYCFALCLALLVLLRCRNALFLTPNTHPLAQAREGVHGFYEEEAGSDEEGGPTPVRDWGWDRG
jgi:hypothetical protein